MGRDISPVARPAKNLAAMSMAGPFAKIVSSQLMRNGRAKPRMVGRRPSRSASTPTGRALIAAPIARIEDTMEPGKDDLR